MCYRWCGCCEQGGVLLVTFMTFVEASLAGSFNAVGEAFLVAGEGRAVWGVE